MRMRPSLLACQLACQLACLLALAGCAGSQGGTSGGASCAALVELDGHRYVGVDPQPRDLRVTGRTVVATVPGCSDVGGADPSAPTRVRVDEIAGVPTGTAVALDDLVYVREGARLPAEPRPEGRR